MSCLRKADARTMCPDSRVCGRDSLRGSIGSQAPLFQIYLAQELSIGWRNHLERAGDTLTDRLFKLRFGGRGVFQLSRPTLECRTLGGAAAVVVDDRVAQDAIEPGNGGLVGAQAALGLEGAQICSLQNVLGKDAIVNAALDECEKAPAQIEK